MTVVTNGIPAWFVLVVIVASSESESILCPNDLLARRKSSSNQAIVNGALQRPRRTPHISYITRKQRPCLAPIRAIIVKNGAHLGWISVDSSLCPPSRFVVHPIRRIGDHEVR